MNINKPQEKDNNANKFIVITSTLLIAISNILNASPNEINQKADNAFLNSNPKIGNNYDINNQKINNDESNNIFEFPIERDPKAIQKADKKINKAKGKLDLSDLGLTTHEIDSLLSLNLKQLEHLKSLTISGCDLSKGLPQSIFKLEELEFLDIQESILPETINIEEGDYKIKKLYVSFNKNLKYINGIQYILDNLEKLDIADTKIRKNRITENQELNKKIFKEIKNKERHGDLKIRN